MKKYIFVLITIAALFNACGSGKVIVPLSDTLPTTDDNYTIVWLGNGRAYHYSDGQYRRDEKSDYTFEVIQRRYGNTWKSVKTLHRIHPEYKSMGGKRDQTMYFEVEYTRQGDSIVSEITSSWGTGQGVTDAEFREQHIIINLNVSSLFPFNTMRITQHYQYENGLLTETVELFKLKKGKETPFVKIEETAVFFRPVKLDYAPTVFE